MYFLKFDQLGRIIGLLFSFDGPASIENNIIKLSFEEYQSWILTPDSYKIDMTNYKLIPIE